jgi:hypothetical protein
MSGCECKRARSASAIARSLNKSAASDEMIRHYAAMGLQLLGLIVTGEALLLYFGDMGPLMKTASIGAGLFYAGRFIRPRTGN